MNSHEAYALLGLHNNASEADINSAFRKKAAKLHPDVNKSENAEADFKKLNEAYQLLLKPKNKPKAEYPQYTYWNININNDIFSFTRQPKASVDISFIESIIGVKSKKVSYNRKVCCTDCSGKRIIIKEDINKTCDKCNGKKFRTYGDDAKEMPCNSCRGTGHLIIRDVCQSCSGSGSKYTESTVNVSIPPGITDNEILMVRGGGDFLSGENTYADASIKIRVLSDKDMKRQGNNVVSVLKISLLEALTGCLKQVRTVTGDKTLKIQPGRKHADQIVAQGLGVFPVGSHIFILDVQYPDDLDGLIDYLNGNIKEKTSDGYIE